MQQKYLDRMASLVARLNEASRAYYQEDREIISNYEYDQLYDELVRLEAQSGTVLAGSPTQKVGYEVLSKLEKDRHEEKALSLDKTKDRGFIRGFLGERKGVLSWKMDGLTIVATYDNGALTKAVTRGNGEVGEVVTHNARFFQGLPQKIACTGHLSVRGEAFISYSDFNRINDSLPETAAKYKNPRNLASGAVRQLDAKVSASRCVQFQAFELVSCDEKAMEDAGLDPNLFHDRLAFLKVLGFGVVGHMLVDDSNADMAVDDMAVQLPGNDFPSDGLVLMHDDVAYGKSLGTTGKFPRCGIAFKWADETAETTLREIEWNTSRTGLINPVAVFDTVELEGTEVSRASAHNVSILKELKLSPGSRIKVYKANMIIPAISENISPAGPVEIPKTCPVCGAETILKISPDGVETLYCGNDECPAKHLKAFVHFVSREAMNIEGLSEATLELLVDAGYVKKFKDLFSLSEYADGIASLEGMGKRSAELLIAAAEKARHTTLDRFLCALGIPLIGRSASREISKAFNSDMDAFLAACQEGYDFEDLPDFGEKMADSLCSYMETNTADVQELAGIMEFEKPEAAGNVLAGKTFVITGSVTHYANRDELKAVIEGLGGKVSGSVSAKTSYLINNDVNSASGKNKKAKELGVSIISEEDFLGMIGN